MASFKTKSFAACLPTIPIQILAMASLVSLSYCTHFFQFYFAVLVGFGEGGGGIVGISDSKFYHCVESFLFFSLSEWEGLGVVCFWW